MKVIVTGSSRGIGLAIAKKFISCGHCVVGIDVAPSGICHANYTHVTADILTGELPNVEDADILINNAGVQDTAHDIDVNLKGTMRVTERYAFNGRMKSVLFIASASAQTGAEFPAYAASKGGVVAYMKNVALRLSKSGGTANSLSPGGVITPLNDRVMNDPMLWEKIMVQTPLKKWAAAEEIAEWAYFVTVVNKSMTAQDILIDNGEAADSEFIW